MLQLNQVSKHYGPRTLFEGMTLQIHPKTRLGLIGRNGCGKSTILKLLNGDIHPDGGSVTSVPGTKISYLSQEPRVTATNTLEAEMRSAFPEIIALQAEELAVLGKLEALEGSSDREQQEKWANRLGEIYQELDRLDAASMDARIGKTLNGLGFLQSDIHRKVGEYSGGWKMRINLAKLLLEKTDVFLLDEPTNHLDLEACEWLEAFLKDYPGAVVVVSHDRRFLDQLTTETAEIELGKLILRAGNYTESMRQKAEEREHLEAAYSRQQGVLEKQTAFVERFRASATRSTQAKSREKQLAKIDRIELPDEDKRRMKVSFPAPVSSGKQVMSLRNIAKTFGENRLFQNLSADIQRYQRIFILGPNGCGKTTLFRLLLGQLLPDQGEVKPGMNVNLGYFSQNQLETLDAKLSVYDTMEYALSGASQWEVRGLLARFLFTGDDVFKPVSVLSGGEKSKLALAKLMVEGPNTLLLDEPTNHMDISAKEVLEEAFLEFQGTVLCVSHDRYFIQTLATEIWEFYEGQLLIYQGDYDYYLSKRDAMRKGSLSHSSSPVLPTSQEISNALSDEIKQPDTINQAGRNPSPLQAKRDLEKLVSKVEKQILNLEQQISQLLGKLELPEFKQDFNKLNDVHQQLETKHKLLAQHNETWESLAMALGDLS
jgi:ATP-binding cassette, subfamily F, member 3